MIATSVAAVTRSIRMASATINPLAASVIVILSVDAETVKIPKFSHQKAARGHTYLLFHPPLEGDVFRVGICLNTPVR